MRYEDYYDTAQKVSTLVDGGDFEQAMRLLQGLWIAVQISGISVALSLVLGVLVVVAGISPFQYLAGFLGPVWVLLAALGFALGDRR